MTWDRPGLSRGEGIVEMCKEAHGNRLMHQVRDDRGNVFWYEKNELTEANT